MTKNYTMAILWKIFITFLIISPVSFGGGYAMIPLLEKTVTERNKWIQKEDIVDVLAVSQTVPGSIAVNAATFIGYQLAGLPGAIAATLGIITPTFVIVVALAALFLGYHHHPIIQAAFLGIQPAILALILFAALKVGKTAILDKTTIVVAVVALILLLFVSIHPIIVLFIGGLAGVLLGLKRKSNQIEREPDYFLGEGI